MKYELPGKADSVPGGSQAAVWAAAVVVGVITVATYRTALIGLVGRWWSDPDYVHGFLVPVFSVFLLWYRRAMLRGGGFKASLWGLPLLVIAAAMRMVSSYYYYDLLDPASLIPCLAGLTLFVGGWKALRWAWPSIVFLVFMVPLPGFLAGLLGHPLQRFATIASTFVIQTLGIPVVAEGNVICLSDSQIEVADACNGLRNMMLFVTVCVGATFIIRRSLPEKIIIVLSLACDRLGCQCDPHYRDRHSVRDSWARRKPRDSHSEPILDDAVGRRAVVAGTGLFAASLCHPGSRRNLRWLRRQPGKRPRFPQALPGFEMLADYMPDREKPSL